VADRSEDGEGATYKAGLGAGKGKVRAGEAGGVAANGMQYTCAALANVRLWCRQAQDCW
jgi:hypothetical protein